MTIQQLQQYPLGRKGIKIIDKDTKTILWVYGIYNGCDLTLKKVNTSYSIVYPVMEHYSPILYPLSCLTKGIEVYGEKFVPKRVIEEDRRSYFLTNQWAEKMDVSEVPNLPYWLIQLLQSWFINYQGIEAVNPFDLEVNPYK